MSNEKQLWVGDDRTRYNIGDTGFLLQLANAGRGWQRLELRQHPACLDGTPVPRLSGPVGGGSTQVTAMGLARVVEVTRNGRGRVESIKDPADVKAVLADLGYPDLAP